MSLLGSNFNTQTITVVQGVYKGSMILGSNQIQLVRPLSTAEAASYPTAASAVYGLTSDENAVPFMVYATQSVTTIRTAADSCIALTDTATGGTWYYAPAYIVKGKIQASGSGSSFQIEGRQGDIASNFTVTQSVSALILLINAAGSSMLPSPLLLGDGTAAAPSLSFTGDTDLGFYRIGANQLGVTANGVLVATIDTTGMTLVGSFKNGDGTAALPSFTFSSDTDLGFYRIGANQLGVTSNGALVATINTSGLSVVGVVGAGDGTVALPSFTFTSDPDLGIYRIGANQLGLTANGVLQAVIGTTGLLTDSILERVAGAGVNMTRGANPTGVNAIKELVVEYNFLTMGGAVSAIDLGKSLPAGAKVIRSMVLVSTGASAGLSQIAFGDTTTPTLAMVATSTAVNMITPGQLWYGVPVVGTQLADGTNMKMTISGAALTQGKLTFACEYLMKVS